MVRRAHDKHPGAIREVWKNWFPPYGSFGIEAFGAELAIAAENQGRFWELHDLALAPRARSRGRAELEQLAQTAGMDLQRVADERRRGVLKVGADRDQIEMRRLGILYTPNLLINGILLQPPLNETRFDQLIEEELARSLLDRLSQGNQAP
jgi:protein-disulfide isomerase